MSDLQPYLQKISAGESLSAEESAEAFRMMMEGQIAEGQMGAFLYGLAQKGETRDELLGAARTMREKATRLEAPEGAIDVCGTGGDAKGTLNISTAVAIVVAACGVPVAKHGNRSVTSKSGSADVLEALGVRLDCELPVLQRCLEQANICFMMAPQFHLAMKHIAPLRKSLGIRTIFNLLGPLANPAGTKFQLLGVYSEKRLVMMAEVLAELGCERAWVVHGSDGMDELTTTGTSHVAQLEGGNVHVTEVTPEMAGLSISTAEALQGGDAQQNAQAMQQLFEGEAGAYRDIVLLNSAAALLIAGKADDLETGAQLAAAAIDDGRAKTTLEHLARISNEPPL